MEDIMNKFVIVLGSIGVALAIIVNDLELLIR